MANIYYKSNGVWTQIQASDIGAAAAVHTHAFADVSGVAAATHTHAYADVSGVAAATHTHAATDISATLAVNQGGTGKTSHTVNSVLAGNASSTTGAIQNIATKSGALYATAANGAPTFGTLPKAQGGTGVNGSTVTANRVLASPNGSDGAISFRALVKADLPSPFSYYSIPGAPSGDPSSINNNTTGYTSVGTTGWYVLRLSGQWVLATGYISASVAINSAWGNWYRTSADRYLRLPVATTCIHYCSFGTYTGNSVMGVSAQMSGSSFSPWVYNSNGYFHIPFRFTSPSAIATAATQRVPVLVILSAY